MTISTTSARELPPIRRVLAAAAVLVLVVTLGLVASALPAQAQSCSGSTCNGKNPDTQGCGADAHDVGTGRVFSYSNMRIELRGSNACRAVWAQVDILSWNSGGANKYLRLQFRVQRSDVHGNITHTQTRTVEPPDLGLSWTNMVQRSGGMQQRHRECRRFYVHNQVSGERYWQSWSCGPWYSSYA